MNTCWPFGFFLRWLAPTKTRCMLLASAEFTLENVRVAVKMRRADLSVVRADELGPGETFGEACMLEEHRASVLRRSSLNNHDDDDDDDGSSSSSNNNKDNTASRKGPKEETMEEGGPPINPSASPCVTVAAGGETKTHERRFEAPEKSDAYPAGPGEAGLAAVAVDASGGGGPNPNPNLGRSMETYQTLEPTRLVLILKADFHRIPGLLKHCSHAFEVMRGDRQMRVFCWVP